MYHLISTPSPTIDLVQCPLMMHITVLLQRTVIFTRSGIKMTNAGSMVCTKFIKSKRKKKTQIDFETTLDGRIS